MKETDQVIKNKLLTVKSIDIIETRAKRASKKKFMEALDQVSDTPPLAYDQIV